MDRYAAARDEAAAAVVVAKADAEQARLNVEFTRIFSPINGVVGRNLLTVGNLVTQDVTLLTTVVSQDPMFAYFDIDENTFLRIQRMFASSAGEKTGEQDKFPVAMALADEGDDYPHKGTIDFVNNRIDPTTGTMQVRGVFPNPPVKNSPRRMLNPGMFVRVQLPVSLPYQALLVPEEAIGTDQGKSNLLVVNRNNVVEYRPAALGAQQADGFHVVIPIKMTAGNNGSQATEKTAAKKSETFDSLCPGELVIVGGLQHVRPGMEVKPKKE